MIQFVQFPSLEESRHIAEEFQLDSGIPGVIGIIDGTHFEIMKPRCKHLSFRNGFSFK
jgi:hypothetical protein